MEVKLERQELDKEYLDSSDKLKHKLVDFVASDTHISKKRFFYLKKAYEYVVSKYDEKYVEKIFIDNPNKLRGEML